MGGEDAQIHRQHGDLIRLSFFQNGEDRLKGVWYEVVKFSRVLSHYLTGRTEEKSGIK
jgi:hypothetical protein